MTGGSVSSNRLPSLAALALMAFAAIGIMLTYSEMGVTYDEPAHIYTGMEWWITGNYTIEPLHPPLARAAVAAPLYLNNILPPNAREALASGDDVQAALLHLTWDNSHQLLYEDGQVIHRLTLARLAVLPFYLLSLAVVFLWARHLFGAWAALASLALYITLPTPAAHAGLATTDMPYAALCLAALYAFARWLEIPSRSWALAVGAFGALAFTTKFSALMHLPAAALVMILWHHKTVCAHTHTYLKQLPWAIGLALLVIALVYRFQPVEPIIEGIKQVMEKNARGHGNVFLGELHPTGHFWYFPVVWFFKTPLSFLLLMPLAVLAAKKYRQAALPLLATLAVLIVSMLSQINIGVRHILPIDMLLSIAAGGGLFYAAQHFRKPLGALLAALLLMWQVFAFAASYPDRLSYFNALAGDNPSTIASDSNFDWGQDNLRLLYALHAHGVKEIALCMPFTIKDIYPLLHQQYTLRECPNAPQEGWIAVTNDTVMLRSEGKNLDWISAYTPTENIGRTAKLYYVSLSK